MASQITALDAELALIGGLFLAPERTGEIAGLVAAADFSNALTRKTFAAMVAMDAGRQQIDLVTVAERLEGQGALADVEWAALGAMVRDTPSAANVAAYANIVRDRAKRRAIVAMATDAQRWAIEDGDAEKTLLRLRDALDALGGDRPADGPVLLRDALSEAFGRLDRRISGTEPPGLQTGLADFDALTLGIHAQKLYVVAGRPSMGKSVLGLHFAAISALASQKPSLFFTAEMPTPEQVERLLASFGRVDLSAIQSGKLSDDDWRRITAAVEQLPGNSLWFDPTPSPQIADILAKARRLHRTHGPMGMVVIDHAGLVEGRGENREKQQADVSRSCKALAMELACPVVALVQLNRKLEDRADKRPIMSDLRDSGEWEQSADLVMMIYRDEIYYPDSVDKGCAELIMRKHRGGKLGTIPLHFAGQFSRFESLAGGLPSWQQPAAPIKRVRGLSL